jgi:glycosyltransferase involved in cell wall biosynthesis
VNPNLWFGLKAGGSVGHVAGVVNALAASGRVVDLAAVQEPAMIAEEVTTHVLPAPRSFGVPVEANYYRFQRTASARLARIAAERRSELVYQRMSVANYSGPVVSRRLGLPLVVEYNGSEVWAAKHWGRELRYSELALLTEEVCLRHAHLVVTISSVLRAELLERGVEEERIVCYPNCVDPDVYDAGRFSPDERRALRAGLGIAEDAVVATFVGTFGQWHGVDVLARVIERLADTDPEWLARRKLHFLLIGDGLKMPEVQALIGGERFRGLVTLAGLVPQAAAPAYLAASDILLSPHVANADGTPFFGSPTKLFEYMAMGKAIVASDLDQIGEVLAEVGGRRLAVLVPPGDEAALEHGIRSLADDPEERARLGAAARAEVLERYTWRHHVEAILAGLRRVA